MFAVSTVVFAQKPDAAKLSTVANVLNSALVSRDTIALKNILRDDLHYYHSNGWMQSKRDMIDDLYNGKLIYSKISAGSQEVHLMGEIGQVKAVADVEAVMNGKPIQLKLKVVQVWYWKDNEWRMYSRHSEKI
jgi:hypothetical protein